MRLTTFTDYALRVLIYLGAQPGSTRLATIGEIAAAYHVSENHLMKVVHRLAQQGYIETLRGKDGGMRLARAPDQINLGAVVRSTEDDLAVAECFEQRNRNCPLTPECLLRATFARAMRAFFDVLDSQTLADLLRNKTRLATLLNGLSSAQSIRRQRS